MSGETMLTRMVQAMGAELARQCEDNGDYSGPDNGQAQYLDGHYDQSLVAKAALLAIREPSYAMVRAASESVADDGEGGNFGPLFDLLDFSGENKTRLVVAEALRRSIDAILNESPSPSVTHQTGDKP